MPRTRSSDGGGATIEPASRHAASVVSASSRASACFSGESPPCGSASTTDSGNRSSRSSEWSPRDLRERWQQRGQMRVLQRLANGVVVVGKGLDLAASGHSPSA